MSAVVVTRRVGKYDDTADQHEVRLYSAEEWAAERGEEPGDGWVIVAGANGQNDGEVAGTARAGLLAFAEHCEAFAEKFADTAGDEYATGDEGLWARAYGEAATQARVDAAFLDAERVGVRLGRARAKVESATEKAKAVALRALAAGVAEAAVARALGVDRMTVRKWAGK